MKILRNVVAATLALIALQFGISTFHLTWKIAPDYPRFFSLAMAQVACNDPSGFIKSYGPINTGDVLTLGPDCQHVQSIGGSIVQVQTRAFAQTLNLSGFNAIRTLGYYTGGDGGEATFFQTASRLIDVSLATGTITANGTSGCTNGTLIGQTPTGSTGFQTTFTITVAGNIVTAMKITAPGNLYAVGDILSFSVPGCAATVKWTVATVLGPTGSFVDIVGTKFQVVLPGIGIDARAMGVKFDWTVSGGDAAATDNYSTIQNAYNFAAYAPGFIDTGAFNGARVLFPRGTAMFCGSNGAAPLHIWQGVTHLGQGGTASVVKPCDTYANTSNFIELCDSESHVACFSAAFRSAQLFTTYTVGQGSASAVTQAAIYTNSCQHQGCGVYDATIYPGACRSGIKADSGFGGAAMVFLINEVEIKGGMKDANCAAGAPSAVSISAYISTQIYIVGLNLGGLSSSSGFGPRSNGLAVSGGFVYVNNMYAENVVAPVIVNIVGATNGFVHVKGFDAGTNCVNGVLRSGGSTANTVKLEGAFANACTNTYSNAGALSGAIVQLTDVTF